MSDDYRHFFDHGRCDYRAFETTRPAELEFLSRNSSGAIALKVLEVKVSDAV
ncbi:hypothetical protein QQM79_13310 [Marinobacteraceae bacterium S3BR75-40.1]